jgi:hypothetical protein
MIESSQHFLGLALPAPYQVAVLIQIPIFHFFIFSRTGLWGRRP